jgi:hypothetical protein
MNAALWRWRQSRVLRDEANESRKNTSPSRVVRNKKRKGIWNHRNEVRLQLRQLFDSAFIDREKDEKVSMLSSALLDVERGEVLSAPRYRRIFEV